jgi:hypothetical protein
VAEGGFERLLLEGAYKYINIYIYYIHITNIPAMAWQRADSSDFCLRVHEAETRARVHLWKGGEGLGEGRW